MLTYRIRDTAQVITLGQLANLHPLLAFPASGPDADMLDHLGLDVVHYAPPPECQTWETVVPADPVLTDKGWYQTGWAVVGPKGDALEDAVAADLVRRRAAKVDAINAERDRRLALGVTYSGKVFATDALTRTDLGGMATTASLVLAGALDWPDSYAQGWIAADNTRLPLPTPQDGVALAATVAGAYSATVQYARDLKDAALVSDNPEGIDIMAGWPS
ncbi:DUF4376 domain-containing protein [Azospirillum sp. A1-3]|uniref:DUF4376 domain-containing protein n=1 Tax=Azospirillum sp. A1-3 TaxID=185874 RepID=UPI002077328C|nr:DUF4376 domain-containing protein [Azospirillum sp. A1-3]MCM8736583.1 DUF4376 domain-containing protein [Azospirillum sp. A1-3]